MSQVINAPENPSTIHTNSKTLKKITLTPSKLLLLLYLLNKNYFESLIAQNSTCLLVYSIDINFMTSFQNT